MADTRFFKKRGNITVGALTQALGCSLSENADPEYTLEDVAPLNTATSVHLSFFDNIKYKNDFLSSKAGACFVTPEMALLAPEGMICLITQRTYKSYALAAQMFYPDDMKLLSKDMQSKIAPSAYIHPTARIAQGCVIEHNAYIGAEVEIGEACLIEAGAVIKDGVKIGNHCRIGVNASISHTIMGDYVRIYCGVCIGQDGFGFAIDPAGYVKVPQLGRVIMGDHIEIGANSTIDRGAGPDTIIGSGTWIDNLVQIGHNVVLGKGCVIAGQAGISGSTICGDYVVIGGQVGIAGHLKIGKGARIAAKSGIMRDIDAGEEQMGYPAMPMRQYLKQTAYLNNLIKKRKSD